MSSQFDSLVALPSEKEALVMISYGASYVPETSWTW